MLPWLFNILFGIKVSFCSCSPEVRRLGVVRVRPAYRIDRLPRLPRLVNESSGLARRTTDGRTVWTHNDGGGRPTLYGVDVATGTLLDSLTIPGLRNVDWEELAQADTARLFIADVGNNANVRRNLAIHELRAKLPPAPGSVLPAPTPLLISYADQTAFPPRRRNFDCEAVFYRNDSLFLLSKNRAGHQVRLYGLSASPKGAANERADTYRLAPLDSVFIKSMVTGAALSPDGQTLAVLTYGKILFFSLAVPDRSAGADVPCLRRSPGTSTRLGRPTGCLRLPRGQTEGIVFLNDTDLLISNERGRLYRIWRRR